MTRLVCLGVASLYLSALCEEVWGVKGQASPWKENLFMHLRKKMLFFKISELRRPQAGKVGFQIWMICDSHKSSK